MAPKKTKPGKDQKITLNLTMQQTAALGLMFNMVLKASGMAHQQIIYEIQQQIGPQLPKKPSGQADADQGIHKSN